MSSIFNQDEAGQPVQQGTTGSPRGQVETAQPANWARESGKPSLAQVVDNLVVKELMRDKNRSIQIVTSSIVKDEEKMARVSLAKLLITVTTLTLVIGLDKNGNGGLIGAVASSTIIKR